MTTKKKKGKSPLPAGASGALDVGATPSSVKEALLLHPVLEEVLGDGGLLLDDHVGGAPLEDVGKVLLQLLNEHLLQRAEDDDWARKVVVQLLHLHVRRRDRILEGPCLPGLAALHHLAVGVQLRRAAQ
ncbi:hypothetical protein TYRP_015768 [Tyrophagus putrescentiae]|nr:hypothetical protein TYRP_015768 [Tyrophagus putrescentiae]